MEARIREATLALRRMGVPASHIHIRDYPDGALKPDHVAEEIRAFESEFPGALHATTTYLDRHPDHIAAGEALLTLYDSGHVARAQFHVPKYLWDNDMPGELDSWEPEWTAPYQEALNAFQIWLPEAGYYSVGYKSARGSFEQRAEEPRSRRHAPHAVAPERK